jgi:hypothetical protein
MAVSGNNFFSSAWNGFLLNLKHGLVFAWANFLAKLFIVLGKIGITVLNVYTCYLFMKMRGDLTEPGMNLKVPLAFIACFTYFVQNIFLGMFDQGVIAMLTCVACDTDLHNGKQGFGPETFNNKLDKIKDAKP